MSERNIEQSIAALHAEIDKLSVDDEAARDRLQRLLSDLELELNSPSAQQRSAVSESLTESIEHFEVEHPRITGILNDLMVTLSGMGI